MLTALRRQGEAMRYVFCGERGTPLSSDAFRKIIARAGREAGITFAVHPHMLRHACGYKLAQAGQDRGRFRITSATATSRTPYGIRSCRQRGLGISGGIENKAGKDRALAKTAKFIARSDENHFFCRRTQDFCKYPSFSVTSQPIRERQHDDRKFDKGPKPPRRDCRKEARWKAYYEGMADWYSRIANNLKDVYPWAAEYARRESEPFRDGAIAVKNGTHPKVLSEKSH